MKDASAPSLAAARGDGAVLAFGAGVLVASEFVVVGMAPLNVALGQTGMALAALALGVAFYCARPMLTRRLVPTKLET